MDMALATVRRCAEAGRYVASSRGGGAWEQIGLSPEISPQDQLGLHWSAGAVVKVPGNSPPVTGTASPPGVVA